MEELTLQDGQSISLNIMKVVADICEQEGLVYYLAYGTLIGAIRHKGFIPWDDDIDIMMPRQDYHKLIEYFEKHEADLKPLQLFSIYNCRNYPYMITRISDSRYVLDVQNEKSYGMGVFIDIYPLDGVGDTVVEYTKNKNRASRYSSLCFLSTRIRCEKGNTKSKIRLMIKWPAFLYAKVRGKNHFIKKLEKMVEKCDYVNSNYVGCLVWGSDGVKCIFPREWLDETILVPFEGYEFRIPKEYDAILTRLYGDYMKLPPEKDRIAHHFYKIYKK